MEPIISHAPKPLTDIYQSIFAAVAKANHVMLAMHQKPDGDTAGACLAFAHYLDIIGKPHTCFCVDALPKYLDFLPGKQKITSSPHVWNPEDAQFDLVIVFDSGDLSYNGIAPYLAQLTHTFTLINIDHHYTNTHYGDHNLVISTASSTCEIVNDLLEYKEVINKQIATCLMTGLVTDTGGFTNLATTASSIDAAGQLLKSGVSMKSITDNTLQNRSVDSLKLWGKALERLSLHPSGMLTTALLTEDFKEASLDATHIEGVSNFLNSVDNETECKAICVLMELPNGYVKGSLRTRHPLIDVTKFATLLGGGGHKKAAGFKIKGRLQHVDGTWVIINDEQKLTHEIFIA